MSVQPLATILALLLLSTPATPYHHHHLPDPPAMPGNATGAPDPTSHLGPTCTADSDLTGQDLLDAGLDSASRRSLLAAVQQLQQPQPMLASRRYISYASLRADVVPCSRPGVPYYNCLLPARANAYHRGCGTITRCARFDFP